MSSSEETSETDSSSEARAPLQIDHSTHPHIIESIFYDGPYLAILALRGTSSGYRDHIDSELWRHVALSPHPPVLRSFYGYPLPVLSAITDENAPRIVAALGRRFAEGGVPPPLPTTLDFFHDALERDPTTWQIRDPFSAPFQCPELRVALSRVTMVRCWGRHARIPDALRPTHRVLFGWEPPERYDEFAPARGPPRGMPLATRRRGTVRAEPGPQPFKLTLNLDINASESVYDPWLDPPGAYSALTVIFTARGEGEKAPSPAEEGGEGVGRHDDEGEGEGGQEGEGQEEEEDGEESVSAFGADLACVLNTLGRSTTWKTTFVNADIIPRHVLASRSFRAGIARRQGDPGAFTSLREALEVVRGVHWRFYYDAFEFLSLDEYRARVGDETFRLQTDEDHMRSRAPRVRSPVVEKVRLDAGHMWVV
jgi:hypothetical protein